MQLKGELFFFGATYFRFFGVVPVVQPYAHDDGRAWERTEQFLDNIFVTGWLEALIEVALQSFDGVHAICMALQVAEEDLAVLFVSDELGEA